jgi:hypothetical protein
VKNPNVVAVRFIEPVNEACFINEAATKITFSLASEGKKEYGENLSGDGHGETVLG